MAGLSVFDWNKTPSSNTDVNNIGISGGDNVSSGDDAMRAILGLISQYNRDNVGLGQTIGGTANAITVTINQAWASLADGQLLAIVNTGGPNTGATTLAVTNSAAASLGTKAIRLNGDTALAGGEMLDNGVYLLRYVATYNSSAGAWALLNPSVTSVGLGTAYYGLRTNSAGTGVEWAALTETIAVAISDETTALTTGTAKVTFRMPYAFTVTSVKASLTTASSSGTPTFDINEGGTTILSTKLTIDANELTSATAATAAVISDTALAVDAEMTVDIDTAGTGAKGAKIYIIGYRTS